MDQARDSPVDPDHERIGRFRFGLAWVDLVVAVLKDPRAAGQDRRP